MQLPTTLRREVWRADNWFARLTELEWSATRIQDPWQRSDRYLELAAAAEWLVPNRERALELYRRAWQSSGDALVALTRGRVLARELGRLDLCAEIAAVEYAATGDLSLLFVAAEAWLDAGELGLARDALRDIFELGGRTEVVDGSLSILRPFSDPKAEISRIEGQASSLPPGAAAMRLVDAALLARMTKGESSRVEPLLLAALELDLDCDRALRLLEAMYFQQERYGDFARLLERVAVTRPQDRERVDAYRRLGVRLVLDTELVGRGSQYLRQALAVAYANNVPDVPGHLAILTLLGASTASGPERFGLGVLYDSALSTDLSDDERLFVSCLAAKQVWADTSAGAGPERYLATVKGLVPEHPLVVRFERERGRRITRVERASASAVRALRDLALDDASITDGSTQPYIETPSLGGTYDIKRRAPRVTRSVAVQASFASRTFRAFTRDLSEVGVFVRSGERVPVGTEAMLSVRMGAESGWREQRYQLATRVVRSEDGNGFAAEVLRAPGEYCERVRRMPDELDGPSDQPI